MSCTASATCSEAKRARSTPETLDCSHIAPMATLVSAPVARLISSAVVRHMRVVNLNTFARFERGRARRRLSLAHGAQSAGSYPGMSTTNI